MIVIKKYFISLLCVFPLSVFAAGNWYEGGDLHKASVRTWKTSSHKNKLSTASDWALISPSVKAKVNSSGNFNTNKIYAQKLVTCIDIDIAVEVDNVSSKVTDYALTCMMLMGWLEWAG